MARYRRIMATSITNNPGSAAEWPITDRLWPQPDQISVRRIFSLHANFRCCLLHFLDDLVASELTIIVAFRGRKRMRARARRAVLPIGAVLLGILSAAPVAANPLRGTVWETGAQRVSEMTGTNVDSAILYALALIESGRDHGAKVVAPWPWALNIGGRAHYPASKVEAIQLLGQAAGPVDVGLGQISVRWHGARVSSPTALLDPQTNLEIVADILIEGLSRSGSDLELGIGRYHSWDEFRGRQYGRRVLELAHQLRELWGAR